MPCDSYWWVCKGRNIWQGEAHIVATSLVSKESMCFSWHPFLLALFDSNKTLNLHN